jgi:hypothetical protein
VYSTVRGAEKKERGEEGKERQSESEGQRQMYMHPMHAGAKDDQCNLLSPCMILVPCLPPLIPKRTSFVFVL